jgi:hypothetical protein
VSESSQSSDFSHHVAFTFSQGKSSIETDSNCVKEITISSDSRDLVENIELVSPHEMFQPSMTKNRNKLVKKVNKIMMGKGVKSLRDLSNDRSISDQSLGTTKVNRNIKYQQLSAVVESKYTDRKYSKVHYDTNIRDRNNSFAQSPQYKGIRVNTHKFKIGICQSTSATPNINALSKNSKLCMTRNFKNKEN